MTDTGESRNSQIFEQVWDTVTANIDKVTQDETDRKFLKSLAMGGTVAAESVVTACAEIQKYWGEGSEATATELSQLFSLLMLSQVYRWLQEKPPKDMTSTVPPEVSATRIVYVFGGEPEQGMDDFVHFDKQWEYDLRHHPHLVHISSLLLARCAEICGHKAVDWDKVKWPVVEMTHLVKGAIIDGAAMRSKLDIDNMLASLNSGVQAMMSFYGGS
jgi:hypothetical protein